VVAAAEPAPREAQVVGQASRRARTHRLAPLVPLDKAGQAQRLAATAPPSDRADPAAVVAESAMAGEVVPATTAAEAVAMALPKAEVAVAVALITAAHP
jgi:hypothetical protein